MILPIVAYGTPVLRKKAQDIAPDHPELAQIIANMFETMYKAEGVGLAAPQVNLPIRLFVIAPGPMDDQDASIQGMEKVFINAQITEWEGEQEPFVEGCLSIPGIRETVLRKPRLRIRYLDKDFNEQHEWYEGVVARVIAHEYDHIEGVLFTDLIPLLKRKLLRGRLDAISKGKVQVEYRMRFPNP